jgi:hypothetical protein
MPGMTVPTMMLFRVSVLMPVGGGVVEGLEVEDVEVGARVVCAEVPERGAKEADVPVSLELGGDKVSAGWLLELVC